ncbi:hypothetical protein WA026_009987 [Henosepilachna vigintioctopunctata]|uniref:Glucose dehydrogenase [FAD, quinone]-like n=1 Tax=Henosepilachna vigintioctopunctata TaxID=420089 RepID=A0AAW1TRQ4_9CUCU
MSEVESFEILLLEAGNYDDDLTKIPYLTTLLELSDKNWGYFSTPQKNGCFGWKGNRCSFLQGKVLGGSGSIDCLAYIRGNRDDYDKWAALGNPGWSFREVLPFFKKMENYQSDKIDLNYRGFGGPANVAYEIPEPDFTITENVYKELGIPIIQDYNAEKQIGVSRIQRLTNYGQAVSGATAYVRPSLTKHNFNLTLTAFVTKILINKSTKTAYGVEFVKNGVTYRATARKEVIISAGVVNTPQLLMLSGIGPSDELAKHKIPIVANLPVGKVFKGNIFFDIYYLVDTVFPLETLEEVVRQFLMGKGVLTNFQNGLSVTFLNTKNNYSSVPNLEITFYSLSSIDQQVPSLTNFIPEVQKFADQFNSRHVVFFEISLLHPKSNGNITLKSNNPSDFPNINLGIFDNVADMDVLYDGIQFIRKILSTKEIQLHHQSLIKYDFCDKYEYDSKDYWYCALKYVAYPGYHWSSSAKMGPLGDPYAVVDYKLRVNGIKKLRIVDRSVVPVTISGHYDPSSLMIGEKAADMIKKEYGVFTKIS